MKYSYDGRTFIPSDIYNERSKKFLIEEILKYYGIIDFRPPVLDDKYLTPEAIVVIAGYSLPKRMPRLILLQKQAFLSFEEVWE